MTLTDPNEALRIARASCEDGRPGEAVRYYSYLDDWISGGGHPPDEWADRERKLTAAVDMLVAFIRRDQLLNFVREVAENATYARTHHRVVRHLVASARQALGECGMTVTMPL